MTAHAPLPDVTIHEPGAARFGTVNWLGFWTLFRKEIRRFLKVAFQTVFAPIITTLLYLTVFLVAFAGADRDPVMGGGTVAYAAFLPPGLIMMGILNNAFQNASSSLIIGKMQGTLVDILMPPLSAAELTAAFVLGAAVRGLLVGLVTLVTIAVFMAFTDHPTAVPHPLVALYFAVMASIILGAAGAVAGMWSDKFDQLALVTNFIITPLTFLSGTFYSVRKEGLPDWVGTISDWNPLFYLIDGFRFGFIGVSDAPISRGAVVAFVLAAGAIVWTFVLFRRGYKLKS